MVGDRYAPAREDGLKPYRLLRLWPGLQGWALVDDHGNVLMVHSNATTGGTPAQGLTRWEARQVHGLLFGCEPRATPADLAEHGGER